MRGKRKTTKPEEIKRKPPAEVATNKPKAEKAVGVNNGKGSMR